MQNEKLYIFCGVIHTDKDILDRFNYPEGKSIVSKVTGTSQNALPSDKEMDKISGECPCIVFPVAIKRGLLGSSTRKVIDLKEYLVGKMASIIYVDSDTRIYWAANEIDMKSEKFVEICVNGTELVQVKYFVPQLTGV